MSTEQFPPRRDLPRVITQHRWGQRSHQLGETHERGGQVSERGDHFDFRVAPGESNRARLPGAAKQDGGTDEIGSAPGHQLSDEPAQGIADQPTVRYPEMHQETGEVVGKVRDCVGRRRCGGWSDAPGGVGHYLVSSRVERLVHSAQIPDERRHTATAGEHHGPVLARTPDVVGQAHASNVGRLHLHLPFG